MSRTWPAEEIRAATTTRADWCSMPGCARSTYAERLCREHYDPAEPPACGHGGSRIVCGCCRRAVCFACYGHWKALACVVCRAAAA